MGNCNRNGFTLVELLTVIAMIGLLSAWLISAGEETYYDYQVRLAIEQAQQDLQLLEIIRRGGNVAAVTTNDLAALRAHVQTSGATHLLSFTDLMSTLEIDDEILIGEAQYTLAGKTSVISVTFPEGMVENVRVPGAEKSAGSTPGTTVFDLNYRESDPLVHSYVADPYYMKQRLGR